MFRSEASSPAKEQPVQINEHADGVAASEPVWDNILSLSSIQMIGLEFLQLPLTVPLVTLLPLALTWTASSAHY